MASKSPVLPQKRPQPDSSTTKLPKLLEPEKKVYDIIIATKNMGILQPDLRKKSELPSHMFNKVIKALEIKNYIKEVPNVNNKKKKLYMGKQFVPSDEVTGGALYEDGELDIEFVNMLKELCLERLQPPNIATKEELHRFCDGSPKLSLGCSMEQVSMIVQSLVDTKEVEELRSSGLDIFSKVPKGKICYRIVKSLKLDESAGASFPCLFCPRIYDCTPNGVISPITCEYYNKWLSF